MANESIAPVSDLSPLRAYWHPVAIAEQVSDRPLGVQLLGEQLVVWRSREGRIHAFNDLCIHRGSMLSLGRLDEEGHLVCAYHGWTYDGDGKCTYIPSQPRDKQRVPLRARAVAYQAEVRYGLVWVALEEPLLPIADFPEYDDPHYRVALTYRPSQPWKASAARAIENFLDRAHVPIVHVGLLRDGKETEIEEYEVEVDEAGLSFSFRSPVLYLGGESEEPSRRDWLAFPFTAGIRMQRTAGTITIFFTVQPVAERECMIWFLRAQNFDLDKLDSYFVEFDTKLTEQDREVVESQRPEMLPVELSEELHVKGVDAASIEYRRMLKRKVGLMYA